MTLRLLIVLAFAALCAAAFAQVPATQPRGAAQPAAKCEACGVVRSVRRIESTGPITEQERKSQSGLVASIPFGGGKAAVGSSTDVRRELKPPTVSWEVVVLREDGKFQVVTQDDASNLGIGDKVRIERGKVLPRE